MPEPMTKDIFCAKEQTITPHTGDVDGNGDFVFTCANVGADEVRCDRFVKFPGTATKEELESLIVNHQEKNVGQVSLAAQEAVLDAVIVAEDSQPVE